MPVLSIFFGMIIRMYHADHNPPHFHVQYGEFEAIFEIKTGRVLAGKLPKKLILIVNEWRKKRLKELEHAWKDALEMKALKKIKPLD